MKKEYDGVRNMSNNSKKRERKEVESQFCLQINPIIFDRGNGRV